MSLFYFSYSSFLRAKVITTLLRAIRLGLPGSRAREEDAEEA